MSHLILDISSIKNDHLLHSMEDLKTLMEQIVEKLGFTILHRFCHQFQPQGITIVYALSESHISFHTYPEDYRIAIDIYTCRKQDREFSEMSDMLESMFEGVRIKNIIISRWGNNKKLFLTIE